MTTQEKKLYLSAKQKQVLEHKEFMYKIKSSHTFIATSNCVLSSIEIENINLLIPEQIDYIIQQLNSIKDAAQALGETSVKQFGVAEFREYLL